MHAYNIFDIIHAYFFKVTVEEFDYPSFMEYLMSIAGGRKNKQSATAIVTEIKNYFSFISLLPSYRPGMKYYDGLLNLQHLKAYLDYLQQDCEFAPSTTSEKIHRLRLAMEFTLFHENPTETNTTLYTRTHLIMAHLSNWGKSLSKAIKEQRRQQSLLSAQQVAS